MTTYPHEAASTASPNYQNFSSTRERGAITSRYGSNSSSLTFNLRVEQEPLKSRMSGVGEKNNRRPIDPPPAVSVTVQPSGDRASYLGFPACEAMMLFLQVSLVHATNHEPVVVVGRERQMSPIVGVTTATMHRITLPSDWQRPEGHILGVFAFTDLSIRQEGAYNLKFDLFELTNGEAVWRSEIFSNDFRVYPAKSFPGMAQSTDFTDILKKHGIRVRVSKSVRNTKKELSNMGAAPPTSKFRPENDYPDRHHHIPQSGLRHAPYDAHHSRRFRGERERGSPASNWQYTHMNQPQSLLPPPNHAMVSPTSQIPVSNYDSGHPYEPRNEYNQAWAPLPTLQHIGAPYLVSRSEGGNRSHESRNYTHRETQKSVLPVPTGALPSRPHISEVPRRGSLSHTEHSMHYTVASGRHQNSAANTHFGYNPAQESRQASLPERQNGTDHEGHQHWPPPPPGYLPVPEQYNSSKGYQGFNNR